jgi:uncharacterized protein
MLYDVATLTVRVTPRSTRPGVEFREGVMVVRVQAPPTEGRATEEARRVLAGRLRVAPSAVRLRSGGRSRVKVFDVEGLSDRDVAARIETENGAEG